MADSGKGRKRRRSLFQGAKKPVPRPTAPPAPPRTEEPPQGLKLPDDPMLDPWDEMPTVIDRNPLLVRAARGDADALAELERMESVQRKDEPGEDDAS